MSVDQYLWIYFLYCRTDVTRLWGNLFAVLILWDVQTRLSSSQYTITWTAMSWTPDIISLTLSINLSAYTAPLSFHKHRNFIIPQNHPFIGLLLPSLDHSTFNLSLSFHIFISCQSFCFCISSYHPYTVILAVCPRMSFHDIATSLAWHCHVAMTFPQCHHITILP